MSASLYRTYRPKRFSDLVGQDHAAHALRTQVATGRVGHGYLFTGPRGCGKTSSARILAAALNCTGGPNGKDVDGEPCGACESCITIAAGTSADVHELDAASNSSVNDIRELISRVALGNPGRRKVYIVDEVHMLSSSAAAALLKTLEEPPAHVCFVLATTNPEKLPATVRSRLQPFQFRLVGADELAAHVRWVADDAGLVVTDEIVAAVTAAAQGSVRDALSALETAVYGGDTVDSNRSARDLVVAVLEGNYQLALSSVAVAVSAGVEPRVLLAATVAKARDWFLFTQGADELMTAPITDDDRILVAGHGPRTLVRLLETAGEVASSPLAGVDLRVALEVNLVRLCRVDTEATLAAHQVRIAALEATVAALSAT